MSKRTARHSNAPTFAIGLQILGFILLSFGAASFAMPAVKAGDDLPQWLRQASSASLPPFGKNVPAVVLWNESRVSVDEDGRMVTVNYHAVKILTREGRGEATAGEIYRTDSGKVREMRGWMIRPSGEIKKYGKDQVVELALVGNDVYNEAHRKAIIAIDDAEPGAIFAYEAISEERSVFTQLAWAFQEQNPVILSRVTIALPSGWRAEGVTLNHDKVDPVVSGSSYSWELRNLPYIEDEPASPPETTLAPRIAISYFPGANAKPSVGKTFDSWVAVSRWLSELGDPQAVLDDALAGKSKQLTESSKTELERIRAVGRYVQGVNYVSIQTGVGRGGGYRPHSSIEVFNKAYGDCKDKANLMRAMLKALGIKSYLVSIYSGDPNYVRQEWPSPQQFNHCIIAIKVSDETQVPTTITHPTLGRLMIFDPTDDNTPVGDLPDHEQGSLALIVAGDAGELMRMPVTPPEANRLERSAEVKLEADGSIIASLKENSVGQSAVDERRGYRGLSHDDYLKMVERWISRGASGAKVSKIEPTDNAAEGRFALAVEFTAPRYGQLMQDRLLVFKPAIVSRRESLFLTEATRKHPVVLRPLSYTESVRVKLPATFEVDELPDATKLNGPFGSYETGYVVKDGELRFTRSLVVRGATIPVADYYKVRNFFEKIRSAEQAPVVLARK